MRLNGSGNEIDRVEISLDGGEIWLTVFARWAGTLPHNKCYVLLVLTLMNSTLMSQSDMATDFWTVYIDTSILT